MPISSPGMQTQQKMPKLEHSQFFTFESLKLLFEVIAEVVKLFFSYPHTSSLSAATGFLLERALALRFMRLHRVACSPFPTLPVFITLINPRERKNFAPLLPGVQPQQHRGGHQGFC